jgi:hypothetical protein
MDSSIQLFQFEGHEIRTIQSSDEVWWVASDIANVLGYDRAANMTRVLDDDEKGTQIVSTLGGQQDVTVINESGLYNCIFNSRKEEAKYFKRWVTKEVLPTLRKTGSYTMPSPQPSPKTGEGVTMTLPDGTRLEGLPVSAVQHLIPSGKGQPQGIAPTNIQPQLFGKHGSGLAPGQTRPGQKVYDYEGTTRHLHGWQGAEKVAKAVGCSRKTLTHKVNKRTLPKNWGFRIYKNRMEFWLP